MSVAYGLTPLWGEQEFLPSQLMQAVGQSFALSGIIFFGILNMRPQDALTFGAMLQMTRLFGGEAGAAMVATVTQKREQRASNLIGQHIQRGALDVVDRLHHYAQIFVHSGHPPIAAAALLANAVRNAATTQATIDGFVVVAACAAFGLMVVMVLLPTPPQTPASHIPFFRRRPAE